jgi:hypothetical protein
VASSSDGRAPSRCAEVGGLLPSWTKDAAKAKRPTNARSETVTQLPSFRGRSRSGAPSFRSRLSSSGVGRRGNRSSPSRSLALSGI